jgi:hypothetical protein
MNQYKTFHIISTLWVLMFLTAIFCFKSKTDSEKRFPAPVVQKGRGNNRGVKGGEFLQLMNG